MEEFVRVSWIRQCYPSVRPGADSRKSIAHPYELLNNEPQHSPFAVVNTPDQSKRGQNAHQLQTGGAGAVNLSSLNSLEVF